MIDPFRLQTHRRSAFGNFFFDDPSRYKIEILEQRRVQSTLVSKRILMTPLRQ